MRAPPTIWNLILSPLAVLQDGTVLLLVLAMAVALLTAGEDPGPLAALWGGRG
jgi:hypothetical protein